MIASALFPCFLEHMESIVQRAESKSDTQPHRCSVDGGEDKASTSRVAEEAPQEYPAPIQYDAEDIEEANRIGAALDRQHARGL